MHIFFRKKIFLVILLPLILANCLGNRQSSSIASKYGSQNFEGSSQKSKDEYRALVILPTSGQHETIGKDMKKAAQMAFYDPNASKLELEFFSYNSSKDQAALIEKIKSENIDIILGPVFSNQTATLKNALRGKNIPIISFSNDITLAGNNTYIIGFDPAEQVNRVIDYSINHGYKRYGAFLPNIPYGKHVYQAFYDQINQQQQMTSYEDLDLFAETHQKNTIESPLIQEVRASFNMPYKEKANDKSYASNASIVDVVFYGSEIADIQKKVEEFAHFEERKNNFEKFIKPYAFLVDTKKSITSKIASGDKLSSEEASIEWMIKKHGHAAYQKARRYYERHKNDETKGSVEYDAILMADSGKQMQMIAAMMPYYNIDPKKIKFLGTGLWDEAQLGEESAIRGAWFAAPSPTKVQSFESRFENLYGYKPVRLSSLAYDSVALITLLTKTYHGYPFSHSAFTQDRGFDGVNGLFRLKQDGVIERDLPILAVTKNGSKVINTGKSEF